MLMPMLTCFFSALLTPYDSPGCTHHILPKSFCCAIGHLNEIKIQAKEKVFNLKKARFRFGLEFSSPGNRNKKKIGISVLDVDLQMED